ncbi:hypothetical protein B7486_73185 [cyanobacterium TDX16]|nr:hypothetical protein B7486_73185 [cyanobacterium TDX16]
MPTGPCTLGVQVRRVGGGGTATLVVDDAPVGAADIPFLMQVVSSVGSSVGRDHGSPVSDRYDSPHAFEGVLHEVQIQLVRRSDVEDRTADAAQGRAESGRQ